MASILTNDYGATDKIKVYSINNVIITANDNTDALRNYGNALGLLLKAYTPKIDDASIALAGIQGKNPNAAHELKDHATSYQIILNNLIKMPVPQSVSTAHLALENGASNMIYIANSLSAAQNDPVLAINGLKLYKDTFTSISNSLVYIKATMFKANIHYLETEGGSYFNLK